MRRRKRLLWALPVAALLIWQRTPIWLAVRQLFLGLLVMLAALPLMRRLEKRFSPGIAASLAMTGLTVGLAAFLTLFLPTLAAQSRQIGAALPGLYRQAEELAKSGEEWLSQNGLTIGEKTRERLLGNGEKLFSSLAAQTAERLSDLAGSLGGWLLAPVLAYYLLRDRRRIADWMLMLLPEGKREMTVRIVREMCRESAGYLRGQLLISAVVGGCTGLGLLLCGVRAWFLLGALMGVLELIPYVGPFLGGAAILLFAVPGGTRQMLWALGVVLLVQQVEGGMLSPQLMSETTRLHPIAVLLCVTAGGAAAGIGGVLFAIPAVLCARAALRVVQRKRLEERFEKT